MIYNAAETENKERKLCIQKILKLNKETDSHSKQIDRLFLT